MVAAGAIWHRHSPAGSIQWLKNGALDMLHQAMCPALYHCICIAFEIASNSPTFFVVVDSLLPTTIAK